MLYFSNSFRCHSQHDDETVARRKDGTDRKFLEIVMGRIRFTYAHH